jgi:hypothetical protein
MDNMEIVSVLGPANDVVVSALQKLKTVRDEIVKDGIALDLDVTKKLVGAIDAHVDEAGNASAALGHDLQAKALALQAKVTELEAEMVVLKAATASHE